MNIRDVDLSMTNLMDERGYVIIRSAINFDELLQAHAWISDVTKIVTDVPTELQPEFEADGAVRKIRRLAFYDPNFWIPWFQRNGLSQLAKSLVGPNCTLILHACFKKPARVGTPIVPHQDQALWDTSYPGAITAWIALEDATPENGCLEMYNGSHKRGLISHNIPKSATTHQAIDLIDESLKPTVVPMKAGDMILWHRYMAHSSGPNLSSQGRMAMVMVFADAAARDFQAHDELVV